MGRDGWVLLRRPAAAGRIRDPPQGPVHGGAAPALRLHDIWPGRHRQTPSAPGARHAVQGALSRRRGAGRSDRGGIHRLRRAPPAFAALEEAARSFYTIEALYGFSEAVYHFQSTFLRAGGKNELNNFLKNKQVKK